MHKVINYPAALPPVEDILRTNVYAETALAMLCQALLGASTCASGLACTVTSPASLGVLVGPGSMYALLPHIPSMYGTIGADSTNVLKQGVNLSSTTLLTPAPTTSGQSINYLIQAAVVETDTDAVVLQYYNAANPAQPFSGQNNNGLSQATTRAVTVNLSVKAGASASTGSQTTPSADAGYTGLYVVTVAFGATSVTSGNISVYPGAPFVTPSYRGNRSIATAFGGSPLSPSSTYTATCASFTAPFDGVIKAWGLVNLSAAASAGIQCNLYINATSVSNDTTTLSQSHFGELAVTAGTAVVIKATVITPSGLSAVSASIRASGIFIPT